MKTGIELIKLERERQKKKWSTHHDDNHIDGELATVAAAYALDDPDYVFPNNWEYNGSKYSRIEQLMVAGALIAAEIDRLQRGGVRK